MRIITNPNLDEINWLRLTELFELVQCGYRPPEIIRNTFEKSSQTVFVWVNEKNSK